MVKIVSIAFLCALILISLKNVNNDFFILGLIASGVLLFSISLEYVLTIFNFINVLVNLVNIDNNLFVILIKITLIGYLVEFGCSLINDLGLKSLSDKLIFIGKLAIFCISIPVFYSIFNLIMELVK